MQISVFWSRKWHFARAVKGQDENPRSLPRHSNLFLRSSHTLVRKQMQWSLVFWNRSAKFCSHYQKLNLTDRLQTLLITCLFYLSPSLGTSLSFGILGHFPEVFHIAHRLSCRHRRLSEKDISAFSLGRGRSLAFLHRSEGETELFPLRAPVADCLETTSRVARCSSKYPK